MPPDPPALPSSHLRPETVPAEATDGTPLVRGTLHLYVALDWGDEIDLDWARRLVPADFRTLPRRRRTPPSIAYRPPPLRFLLAPVSLGWPLASGPAPAEAEATVFEFGGVSIALHVPFALTAEQLQGVAVWLAEPGAVLAAVRQTATPLYERILPAVRDPLWQQDMSEEYFVFQMPSAARPSADPPGEEAAWLASLVRLEAGPFSLEELAEALHLRLSYTPQDLLVADWAAAVLFDAAPDCDETLQVIEFANLQLLEYRHIDERLDANMAAASRLSTRGRARNWLRPWRSHNRPLRLVGELKVEANDLFERTGNVLKLVGDQYLARVYTLVAQRFHLREWEQGIGRKLEVLEGIYQVLSDQAAHVRSEFLEIIVIVLIALEIVMAFVRH